MVLSFTVLGYLKLQFGAPAARFRIPRYYCQNYEECGKFYGTLKVWYYEASKLVISVQKIATLVQKIVNDELQLFELKLLFFEELYMISYNSLS